MHQARRLECAADGADAPVHHVGRGDHVGTRIRMRSRLPHQGFDRQVVLNVAALVDEAVLTVRGEWIECDVRDDARAPEIPF